MMRSFLWLLGGLALLLAGLAEEWFGYPAFAAYDVWFRTLGLLLVGYAILRRTCYRSGLTWPRSSDQPRPLRLGGWLAYPKALICWLDGYRQTYAVEPGLYYTGARYDRSAPLLVTANYFLTVFLVWRRLRAVDARLLVVDTDGINVWCSAARGRFSNQAIMKELERYEWQLLTADPHLTLIVPKFSLAGVRLQALRLAGIRPVIGPLYGRDLPAFLAQPPWKDCDQDQVLFGLQARAFTWLPGLLQYLGYSLATVGGLFVLEWIWGFKVPLGIVPLTAFLGTAYPLLFPWIPGRRFAVKGLWLGLVTSLGLAGLAVALRSSPAELIAAVLFTLATALFVGLSYTGNSAVSNYSRVRKEIAQFLPLNVLLYLGSLTAFIGKELVR